MKLQAPGTVIDGFEIVRVLHAGGMAHIYEVVPPRPTAAGEPANFHLP